jgi:predicted short-subunit dehydrogenase-like oxidoreductase (DUF2520 family)
VKKYTVSFVGAGRVSKALIRALSGSGHKIREIASKSGIRSRILADEFGAIQKMDLEFSGGEDIIITAVPDDQLQEVLKNIKCMENVIIAHTAGSIGLDIFPSGVLHKAVFYPLQTFSADRIADLNGVPFFLEASDQYTSGVLSVLAESVGGTVHFIDTASRTLLHVAAVFANNFTNYMLTSGKRIMDEAGLEFDYLEPLIKETLSKALEKGPEVSQTGPAVRLDLGTIERHIGLLSFSPDLQNVYRLITESIISYYNNHNK